MEEVLFFFKIIETILGFICMIFHIVGFLDDLQPLPHQMYFCGTFFGFTIIAIFGNIGISLGSQPSWQIEAIVTGAASFFFILSSVFSMYHAEMDYHLMYLSDYEESMHPYFAINKKQSIAALSCGMFYLMHSIMAIDGLIITEEISPDALPDDIHKADINCHQPIQLYILGKDFHDMLQQQKWFANLTGQGLRNEPKNKRTLKNLKRLDNII